MAIQFIFGGSGTGKTTYIYKQMIEKSEYKEHAPLFLVLPEQANLAAEQDIVMLHPKGGTMDIAVVSFTRLAFKVFDEQNVHTYDILDDYGKSMLIMKLLKKHQKEFTYYGSMVDRPGFVDEVKSLLSELYQYQITPKVIEGVLERITPDKSLYHKLADLSILLDAFEEEMRDSYMVTEQILTLLSEVIGESQFLRGGDFYFDGFTGFTPVQYQVIGALLQQGCNLYISFTMDGDMFGKNDNSEHGLFDMSKQSVNRLCKLAEENGIPVLPHISLEQNFRISGKKALLHLERNLFRYPVMTYEEEQEQISVVTADTVQDEITFISKMIQCYVRELNYHYRDFAVITGDLSKQAGSWKQALSKANIPYFIDASEPLAKNPVAEITGMLFDLFRTDFSYESVFAFLKTGYFDINMEDIYLLENYVLKYGVKGYSWWSRPFKGGIKGLGAINQTRAAFVELITPLCETFRKKSAKGEAYLRAIHDFMLTNKIAEKIWRLSIQFEKEGNLRQAKAYGQVYESFIEILDKTMGILGHEELSREHFAGILMTGIGGVHLGLIPATLDQVIVGDMERTRLGDVKILFFAGTNEGLLPVNKESRGILADKDRQQLKDYDITLAPDTADEIFHQQFYLYLQMTKATEHIFISYRKYDEKAVPLRPSYFINRINALFPRLTVQSTKEMLFQYGIERLPVGGRDLLPLLANQMAEGLMEDSTILYLLQENYQEELSWLLEGYCYSNGVGVLDKKLVKKLYGTDMVHSVSRLETYAGCAYRFFLQYGLQLAKREIYKVESTQIGTILHAVMEHFFKEIKEGVIVPNNMEAAEIDDKVRMLTLEAAKEENDTIFESSHRNRHQLEVLIRIAKRSVHHLLRHLKQGNMEPAYFEKYFSPADKIDYIHMALEEDMHMELKGIVDRVDIKETEDAVYVKVIDYKSGAKDIDYVKMYEGRQLQLVVYMNVMLALLKEKYPGKEIIPTGMYYYHIYDPVIEESDEELLEQKRIEESRLTGLVNRNEKSLELMDEKTGLVTPVRYKKDGGLDSRNPYLVTTEELSQISGFVHNKMIEIGCNIIHGQIDINPEKGEINSPCNVCDYGNICRFEPGLGGDRYRIGSQLDKKSAREQILKNGVESDEKGRTKT